MREDLSEWNGLFFYKTITQQINMLAASKTYNFIKYALDIN